MMNLIRRIIYHPIINWMIRNIMYPFRRILPSTFKIPISGIFKLKIHHNKYILIKTNQTNCLTKEVFWNGIKGYEYPSVKLFVELVKTSMCFFDVGANIGYYSLIAAKMNSAIKVYAFEPMDAAFLYMQKNIELNGMQHNIIPIQAAVSDKPGVAEFFVTRNPKAQYLEHHIGGSSSTAKAKDEYSENINVELIDIDSFVNANCIDHVDIIKIDTEATEDKVLIGAEKLIQRDRPIIFCEVLPGRIERVMEHLFNQYGYLFFMPEPEGLRQVDVLYNQPDKEFLFIHSSAVNEIKEFIIKT